MWCQDWTEGLRHVSLAILLARKVTTQTLVPTMRERNSVTKEEEDSNTKPPSGEQGKQMHIYGTVEEEAMKIQGPQQWR